MIQKTRWINLRFFFVTFAGIISGILSFCAFLNLVVLKHFLFFQFLFVLIFLADVVLLFYIIFNKKHKLKKYLKFALAFLLCFVIGASGFAIKYNTICKYPLFEGKQNVSGSICSYGYQKSYYKLVLDNVKVGEKKIKSMLTVYVYESVVVPTNISLGDLVEFSGTVKKVNLYSNNEFKFATYSSNTVYSSGSSFSGMKITDKKPNFIYAIQDAIRRVLDNNMNEENSAIAYSVILGDHSRLSDEVTNAFNYAGISHVLAVSGLHVGFLVAFLYFIIGLFKGGRRTKFFITTPILILYCIMCNFTASVIRASIMAMVFMISDVIGTWYDPLNSIGFSGTLILIFMPLNLFSLGFQLTFMCVFTIVTLANRVERILVKKAHFPKWIASSFAVSICVTIAVMPLTANRLGEVFIASVFSNLLVIPMLSVAYPLLILAILFALMWSKLSFLLVLPELMLHFIKIVANFFANINLLHFRLFNLGYLIVFAFVIMCLVTRFVMANIKVKTAVVASLVVISVVLLGVSARSATFKSYTLKTTYQYDNVCSILTMADNKKLLVGYDPYYTKSLINESKIATFDAWIMADFKLNSIDDYIDFIKQNKIKCVVVPRVEEITSYTVSKLASITNVKVTQDEDVCGVKISFIMDNKTIGGVLVNVNGTTLLFASGTTRAKLKVLDENVDKVDYLILNYCKHDLINEYNIKYDKLIYHNEINFNPINATSLANTDYYEIKL